jgi:hypothetical protein
MRKGVDLISLREEEKNERVSLHYLHLIGDRFIRGLLGGIAAKSNLSY